MKALGVVAAVVVLVGAAPAVGHAAGVPDKPTFTRDIAPIFQEKCEACHRTDSIAPMSLVTYEESRPWARSIKARVEQRQMPPWHIDKTVGIQDFKNDRSLSEDQIATISRWVDQGAPKGDTKDMPVAKVWPNEQGWNFAEMFGQKEPDLVVRATPWTQKAGQNDVWWKPIVETGLTEPRWVRAIEVRPGSVKGRKITHHVVARLQQEETDPLLANINANDPDANQPGTFMEWAVGKQGEMMRPNSGKLMLPGVEDRVRHPLLERRRGHHRLGRARHLLLPEGSGAEVPPGAALDGRHRRCRGHPAEHGEGDAGLLRAASGGPCRELPAAHASARQGDVDGSGAARRPDRRCSVTWPTSISTGTTRTSTPTTRRRCCRRARS